MSQEKKTVKGYKAFDKGLMCRGFQYEVGKEHKTEGKLDLCSKGGMHFCENPLDVLRYYNLTTSEFAEVEAIGEVVTDGEKSATLFTEITSLKRGKQSVLYL